MIERDDTRLIDRWFPVSAVDEACGTPAGSGLTEKAIFTWFASRPIAQARAAVLTALLPNDPDLKALIVKAVRNADREAISILSRRIGGATTGRPVVLDMFSGRGIIPLEAARAGAQSIGIDLSPVATLAGRILADYPSRDRSQENKLPFSGFSKEDLTLTKPVRARYASDIEILLSEIDHRVAERMESFYPRSKDGQFPWGYLWTTTIPCDGCKRRFPLIGSLVLRHPYKKTEDAGQSLHISTIGDNWSVEVRTGTPDQQPTYSSGKRADGSKKKGKTARCIFCGFAHPLDSVKGKGATGEFRDRLITVAETDIKGKRHFRLPTSEEVMVAETTDYSVDYGWPFASVPDEIISSGNVHTVMASGYGYRTFGDLMNPRQARSFVETVFVIRQLHAEMLSSGITKEYASALTAFAASTLCRRIRRSTRGARLMTEGTPEGVGNNISRVGDVFVNQSKINFQFDYLEPGPGTGPGTWASVCDTAILAIRKVSLESLHEPAKLKQGSATALPLRDGSIDVVITDPPYYDMIEYADASDLFYVWLKRVLFDVEPELFGPAIQLQDGLQDKNQEIIVRRVHEPNRVRHDTIFYEAMLAKSFGEARRVLKADGHLIVMFGHSDPDAWRRLLGALQTAGFIVTSAWPSRTESANTGVASIKVTVTIGCRVASENRPIGMGSEVDREVVSSVIDRVSQWQDDGLALEDQLMASYGPAMEVYGRYQQVLNPDGTNADLDHYLALARRTVRDAMRLRVDELPLETFDAITRFAIFWLRAKKHGEVVPKGEARFFAQADELRLDDLRGRILTESKAGFQLSLGDDREVTDQSSVFEVVRAMAYAWDQGGLEAVAKTIALAGLHPGNPHLWAVVSDLANHLPASDTTAKALAGMQRSASTIDTVVAGLQTSAKQRELFDSVEV